MKEAFEKIDLKNKMMKNSGIKVTFCPGKLSEVLKKVRDTQMKMAKVKKSRNFLRGRFISKLQKVYPTPDVKHVILNFGQLGNKC